MQPADQPPPPERLGYIALFRTKHVARLLAGTLIGRLPVGMTALAIVLFVRDEGGSYTLSGVLTAAFGLAQAAGQPLLGRLIDYRGQPVVNTAAALLSGAGLALFAGVGTDPLPLAFAGVLAAGFFTPPLEPALRALWPAVLKRRDQVHTAYAVDAAAQELIFVTAPLLVVLFSRSLSEAWCLLLTGLLGVAGTLVVTTSAPSRQWRGEAREAHWLGPLRAPRLVALFAVYLFVGTALGATNVAAVAYGDRIGDPNAEGYLLAGLAAGALLGGLGYGARTWAGSAESRLRVLLTLLALGYLPLALTPGPVAMTGLAVLAGLFLAPSLACAFVVVDHHAPVGTVTEAFSWLVTAMTVGTALGAAGAGPLAQSAGDSAAFGLCGAAGLVALLILAAGGRAGARRTTG